MRLPVALTLLAAGLACETKTAPLDGGLAPEGPQLFVQVRTVIGRQLPFDVMLLVSRASSMLTNTSTEPPCPSTIGGCGSGALCPAGCPTRLSDVQSALNAFIDANALSARFAVSVFPSDDFCGSTGEGQVLLDFPPASSNDDDGDLRAQAAKAKAALATITPGGMAPIAASLEFLDKLPSFNDPRRTRAVVLVTDGPPNCNGGNPNRCSDPMACRCTVSECSTANGLCELGCLDDENAAAAATQLHGDGVDTVVFAVGPDTTTPFAAIALNKLAIAGSFPRACPTGVDSDCGASGSCDMTTRLCSRAFFLLSSDDLNQPFARIGDEPDPCRFALVATPTDVDHLRVSVNGRLEAPCAWQDLCNTWLLENDAPIPTVVFRGATCDDLRESTVLAPITLRFEIAQ